MICKGCEFETTVNGSKHRFCKKETPSEKQTKDITEHWVTCFFARSELGQCGPSGKSFKQK